VSVWVFFVELVSDFVYVVICGVWLWFGCGLWFVLEVEGVGLRCFWLFELIKMLPWWVALYGDE